MKRYAIVFEESAQADVRRSYDWGCRIWGKKEAQRWLRQLRVAVFRQLSLVPRGFPVGRKMMSFPWKFARWLWDAIAYYSPSKSARFTGSTSEELMSEVIEIMTISGYIELLNGNKGGFKQVLRVDRVKGRHVRDELARVEKRFNRILTKDNNLT
jgi:plasmid stabilization system protein ParE